MNFFHVYLPLVGGPSFPLILTVLVIRKNFYSPVHRVFSLFMLSMGGWAITIFCMRISSDVSQALVSGESLLRGNAFHRSSPSFIRLLYSQTKNSGT